MKSIINKQTTINNVNEKNEPQGFCNYSHLIGLLIRQPKQGGFDYNDIEHRLEIGKAIKDVNGTIELEDATFNYLKKLLQEAKWNFVSEDLMNLKTDILAIK